MADKIYLKGIFGYREDTLENWVANNPVLERGEPSIVRDGADGEWLKIGDGETAWCDLPWKKGVGTATVSGGEIFNDYENNQATAPYSHAKGYNTKASGYYSVAEGSFTVAEGNSGYAGGYNTKALGEISRAEGNGTVASGDGSHSEGHTTTASGEYSHSEGIYTKAKGYLSHAEGYKTSANKTGAHAEGYYTVADGDYSHVSGVGTKATAEGQCVVGKYNAINPSALFIVGNGTSDTERSNALEVCEDGSVVIWGVAHKTIPVVDQSYSPTSENAQSGIAVAEAIGDIETAIDNIIAIQNSLIGGESE